MKTIAPAYDMASCLTTTLITVRCRTFGLVPMLHLDTELQRIERIATNTWFEDRDEFSDSTVLPIFVFFFLSMVSGLSYLMKENQ